MRSRLARGEPSSTWLRALPRQEWPFLLISPVVKDQKISRSNKSLQDTTRCHKILLHHGQNQLMANRYPFDSLVWMEFCFTAPLLKALQLIRASVCLNLRQQQRQRSKGAGSTNHPRFPTLEAGGSANSGHGHSSTWNPGSAEVCSAGFSYHPSIATLATKSVRSTAASISYSKASCNQSSHEGFLIFAHETCNLISATGSCPLAAPCSLLTRPCRPDI